jgi:diguanylate cyclase (GGDEF)-like protein/PAS domain S-box-containing protein
MKKTANIGCPEKVISILENIKDAVCCFSSEGQISYSNKAYNRLINKISRKKRQTKFILFLQDEYRNKFSKKIGLLSQKKASFKILQKIKAGKGSPGKIEWLITGIFTGIGRPIEYRAVGHEKISSKINMNDTLDFENGFRTLLDSANDSILIMDRDKFVDFNRKTMEMFGCTRKQLLSRTPSSFWPEYQPDGRKSRDIAVEKIKAAMHGETRSYELRHRRFDGSLFDTEVSLNFLINQDKKYLMAIIRDVTQRKHREEIIRQLAYHDTLTGLPNRRLFIDRLEASIALAKRNNQKVALMMLDLDNFKVINDSYGHLAGDFLLKAVAHRLSLTLRKSDTIGRMGGDEFMIIISFETLHKESVSAIADKILKAFDDPIQCERRYIKVTPSIGVAIYPDHGDNTDILNKRADSAMYNAKKLGRNRYFIYNNYEQQEHRQKEVI